MPVNSLGTDEVGRSPPYLTLLTRARGAQQSTISLHLLSCPGFTTEVKTYASLFKNLLRE